MASPRCAWCGDTQRVGDAPCGVCAALPDVPDARAVAAGKASAFRAMESARVTEALLASELVDLQRRNVDLERELEQERRESGRLRADLESAQQLLAEAGRLRKALESIRDDQAPHDDDQGGDLEQDYDCYCSRCVAVRALWAPEDAP